MSTEVKRVRYTEFIISLSILIGGIDMNSYWFEKSEMSLAFAFLTLETRFEHITSF